MPPVMQARPNDAPSEGQTNSFNGMELLLIATQVRGQPLQPKCTATHRSPTLTLMHGTSDVGSHDLPSIAHNPDPHNIRSHSLHSICPDPDPIPHGIHACTVFVSSPLTLIHLPFVLVPSSVYRLLSPIQTRRPGYVIRVSVGCICDHG